MIAIEVLAKQGQDRLRIKLSKDDQVIHSFVFQTVETFSVTHRLYCEGITDYVVERTVDESSGAATKEGQSEKSS